MTGIGDRETVMSVERPIIRSEATDRLDQIAKAQDKRPWRTHEEYGRAQLRAKLAEAFAVTLEAEGWGRAVSTRAAAEVRTRISGALRELEAAFRLADPDGTLPGLDGSPSAV